MGGNWEGVEKFDDGFSREVDFRDFFRDKASDDFFAEGDEDDVTRHKRNIRGIGEGAAAGAVDFGGDYLVKHTAIIALFGALGRTLGSFGRFWVVV